MRAWHKHDGEGGEYHLSERVAAGSLIVGVVYAGSSGRWVWYTTDSATLRPGAMTDGQARTLREAKAAAEAALSPEETQ